MIYSTISELPELRPVQSIKTRPPNYLSFQSETPTAPSLRDCEILNSTNVHQFCDSMATSNNSDTLQWLSVVQTAEEVKRTRNRLAQRKSRERRKEREEASTGDSRHPEESRDSSSHSTMPYEATLHPQIQHPDDQSQNFSKGVQRSKAIDKVSFTPSSRLDSFGAGLHPGTSGPDQLGLNMPASDISLLDASSDRHSISQGSESGYQTTSQHNSPFNPYNISAPYSAKNPDHQQDQTQNQYYPGTVHYSGQYIPSSSSLLLPDQIPPRVPGDVTYQHQSQGPLHGQRISYHSPESSSALDEHLSNMEYPVIGALEPEIHQPVPVTVPHEPEDSPSSSLSLETRFERILELVEEAGFDTLDGMAAAYYTAKFQPGSHAHYAQSHSRTRYLRSLLQALNVHSTDWPCREAAGYKDGIARSAVGVYVEELAGFRQRHQQQQTGEMGSPASTGSSDGPDTASLGGRRAATLAEKFRQFFMAVDASRGVKGDCQVFRQQVPQLWSLLTQLAQNAELPQSQGSQIVCGFLYILGVLK